LRNTGVEPDFSLIKFKKLSGGGYFKIVNQSVQLALKSLGYQKLRLNQNCFNTLKEQELLMTALS